MIFIFAVLACIVVEGSACDISLRRNKVFHALNNVRVELSETPMKINLKAAGVPDDAEEVVVFSSVQSGYFGGKRHSSYVVVNLLSDHGTVTDTRKLLYRTYPQLAWSYNSENLVFPTQPSVSCAIQAQVKGSISSGFHAYIQVTGYYTTRYVLQI